MQDELQSWLATRPSQKEQGILAEGLSIDGWKVLGLIGRGGHAELYAVSRLSDGQRAALKISNRTDAASIRRFDRERLILSAGLGVHFPRFEGAGAVEGRPYLITELLHPYEELPHADCEVADFLLSVCSAIASLHAYGFVHRDVKPGNVLFRLSADGVRVPVLIDFGLARPAETGQSAARAEHTTIGGRLAGSGTPGYAAPEQFSGGEIMPAMDVHALGVLCVRCFDGRPPCCWRSIIRCATSSVPSQRFATVSELVRAIRLRHRLRNWLAASGSSVCILIGAMLAVYVYMCKERFSRLESLEILAESLPAGLPDDDAARWPSVDADLKIGAIVRRAKREYQFQLRNGKRNVWMSLPDFANHAGHYHLDEDLIRKYGNLVTNLYDRIDADFKAGKCNRVIWNNFDCPMQRPNSTKGMSRQNGQSGDLF